MDPIGRAILDNDDVGLTEYEIPEWGVTVYLRTLSAGDRIAIEAQNAKILDTAEEDPTRYLDAMINLIAASVCNAAGERLWTREEADGLSAKNFDVVHRLSRACRQAQGMDAEDLEEAEGN